jgi:ligand-binding sensor domain-containing protein
MQRYGSFRLCVFFLTLFGLVVDSPAQPDLEGFTRHSWSIEDGLPDQEIQAIAQTSDNYLWLGTPHGLVRFDGFRCVDYGAKLAQPHTSLRE